MIVSQNCCRFVSCTCCEFLATDSCFWMTLEEPDLVFCCCSSCISRFNLLCVLSFFSAHHSCKERLNYCILGSKASSFRTAAHWMLFFFFYLNNILCKNPRWSAVFQVLNPACPASTSMPGSKSLRWHFFHILIFAVKIIWSSFLNLRNFIYCTAVATWLANCINEQMYTFPNKVADEYVSVHCLLIIQRVSKYSYSYSVYSLWFEKSVEYM